MADNKAKRKGLGRGLAALLGDEPAIVAAGAGTDGAGEGARIAPDRILAVSDLKPNPYQPRRHFDEDALADLVESVRAKGVLIPLLVRPLPAGTPAEGERFEIIAGERRWRAAQRAGLHDVPVVVREITDVAALEIAIVENVQRADLNALEEARGYRRLMDEFGYTQEKVAEAIGKSRSHVANLIRLLGLPTEVQSYLSDGRLSAGHARALVTAEDPLGLAKKIVSGDLSVRQAEALAAGARQGGAAPKGKGKGRAAAGGDADIQDLEARLSNGLGMKVSIRHGGRSGEVRIAYGGLEQLDALIQVLEGGAGRASEADEDPIDDEELADVLEAELGALRDD
ncbi:ParB/RepB/Spo0J family partition protein [Marinibaculum pumilum]|uniref:ParB/RepB/Spo0J family partition protein n=1 Tax=Marinibaculum pumilum TaxID=1766165 RepID=A0ABV7KUV2_9PROT